MACFRSRAYLYDGLGSFKWADVTVRNKNDIVLLANLDCSDQEVLQDN